MITTDHMLAAALVGEVALRRKLGWAGPIVAAVAGLIPDLDQVAIALFADGPFAYLKHHRGLSHSLLFAPVLAAVVAAVACLVCRSRKFGWMFLAALAGVLCQLALDWPTSYGTQLLNPITTTAYALDWIFIIDLYLTAILIVALVLVWRSRRHGGDYVRTGVRGLAAATAYLLFLGALHTMAVDRLDRQLASLGVDRDEVGQTACLPVPLMPMVWTACYTTPGRTHMGLVHVMGDAPIEFRILADAPPSAAIAAVGDDPRADAFFDFARLPVYEETIDEHGVSTVLVYDARFQGYMPGWGWVRRRPFQLRAVVSPDGRVVSLDRSRWAELPD
ncbi:MAG TPA: metal-dependent hydrolase [Phycisphaerae bacterium]|nr:metal-dependent hydrolase [Phycisphaerae bacterium]HOI54199.1 metal-dependent hydrolase [Phycisphaerae bacterium]